MSAAMTEQGSHVRQRRRKSAFPLFMIQSARSSIHIGHPSRQIAQRRRHLANVDGYPQDTTDPDILNVDCMISIVSRQVHLQHGDAVSMKKTVIQMPQVLFDAAGSTVTIQV